MKELDFGKIDLIFENAALRLDILKRDLVANERVVIKPRRYLCKETLDQGGALFGRYPPLDQGDYQNNDLLRSMASQQMKAGLAGIGSVGLPIGNLGLAGIGY